MANRIFVNGSNTKVGDKVYCIHTWRCGVEDAPEVVTVSKITKTTMQVVKENGCKYVCYKHTGVIPSENYYDCYAGTLYKVEG